MSLMQQIRNEQLAARKAGAAEATLYTTLLGEAAMIGKNAGNRETSNDEVIAVVKKFIKNIEDTIVHLRASNATDRIATLTAEKEVLVKFLPQQMREEDIADFVRRQILVGNSSMGGIMSALKSAHGGKYDGKMASAVVKRIIG